MLEIIPGVLETEWAKIEEKLGLLQGLVDWVHLDFSDNTLVPVTTFLDLPKFSSVTTGNLAFEAHLLVSRPDKYMRAVADAGFKRVSAPVEAEDVRLFLDQARYESIEVGLSIDLTSELELLEPFLEETDFVVVQSTESEASQQKFQEEALEKVRSIRSHYPDLPIEVVGGLTPETAKLVGESGADRAVSDSFIWKDPAKIADALSQLRQTS